MELLRALGAIVDPPDPARLPLERVLGLPGNCDGAEHTDLFAFQLYPYASIYLGPEGMLGGEARDRVAGFWRALQRTPPAEPDHLGVLLSLHASLSAAEVCEADAARRALLHRSHSALLWEHIASWVPVYLLRVEELGGRFHRAWARLLMETLAANLDECAGFAELPLHLRAAPFALDEAGADDDILACLLAPACSGVILARADLARAAGELGLGMRAGERRYALAALVGQDPVPTLRWLAGEAARQAEMHSTLPRRFSPIAGFWSERAATSARVLTAMAACVQPSVPV